VLLKPARTVTTIDKIRILCNEVNKTSTSVELVVINILRYFLIRSNIGLEIKSTAGLKNLVEECNGHNTFVHALKFDEMLQESHFSSFFITN